MPAGEIRRGAAHGVRVQRRGVYVYIPALKHTGDVRVPHPVDVGFFLRRQPGMETGGRLLQGEGPDVLGQVFPNSFQQRGAVHVRIRAEGRDLAGRVYARVGAAGAVDLHILPQQAAQQVLQFGLNGIGRVALALPAAVAGAVIGQRKLEIALHGQLRENSASSRPGFCFSV